MKESIERVIEINDKADKIINEAQLKAESIIASAEQTANEIISGANEEISSRLKEEESKSALALEAEIEKIETEKQRLICELEKKFADGEDKWINQTVKEITENV